MAEKRGTGAGSKSAADPAAKESAPRKGARSAGETTPPRSGRAEKSAGTTAEKGAAAKGASTKKAGAKSTGDGRSRRSTAAGGGTGRAAKSGGGKGGPDLKKDLRDFAGARPDGWSHDDWLRFLDDLQARGHNINDRDAIGSMLERERLALALERIPGVGPQRVRNIADRYGYLWRLRETDADQLSREADVPKSVAEKVVQALGR